MIVIDIGCARYGGDYSIERLVEEFQPVTLYGFDPNAEEYEGPIQLGPSIQWAAPPGTHWNTHAIITAQAAWIFDGSVKFISDGLNSQVGDAEHWPLVPCFDLARFITQLPQRELEGDIVLKIDAEGSEYDLLRHLIDRRVDALLKLAWVEWHSPDRGRAQIEEEIACELVEWLW